jgi:carbon storage regulator
MLVLSRKAGESITIEGGITVTVLAQHGTNVSLGIEAPRDIGVMRSELFELPRMANDAEMPDLLEV